MRTVAFMCVMAVGSVGWCADTKAPEKGTINGLWALSSGVMNGEKMDAEAAKAIHLSLASGKYSVKIGDDKDVGTYKTDETKTPHELTIVGTDGPNKGKTILAIYELKGGTLTVCYDMSGKAFPKKFESEPNTQSFLATYERLKSKKRPVKADASAK